MRYLEQALATLAHLPETRERLEQAIDLRFDLRNSLFPLGEFERILGCLREAEGLARSLNDPRRLGQMCVHMCHNLWMSGHPTEALAFGQSAQAIAESLRDVPLQGLTLPPLLDRGRRTTPHRAPPDRRQARKAARRARWQAKREAKPMIPVKRRADLARLLEGPGEDK